MATVLVLLIGALELLCGILSLRVKNDNCKKVLYISNAVLSFGLCYDAFVIGIGKFIGDGALLRALSPFRYIASGLLIPLLLVISFSALNWDGVKMIVIWVITIIFMAFGGAAAVVTDLGLKEEFGILRYVSLDSTPKWADGISSASAIGAVIPVIIVGIIVWKKRKNPFIFIGGLLMFVMSAIGPATGHFDLIVLFSMVGEVLMVYSYFLFAKTVKGD